MYIYIYIYSVYAPIYPYHILWCPQLNPITLADASRPFSDRPISYMNKLVISFPLYIYIYPLISHPFPMYIRFDDQWNHYCITSIYIPINVSKRTLYHPEFYHEWLYKASKRRWFIIVLLTLHPIIRPRGRWLITSLPRNQGDNPGTALTGGIDQMSYLVGRIWRWILRFKQQKSGVKHQTWW